MAHFNLERELNVLRLDSSVSSSATKAPMARWERKAAEAHNNSLSLQNLNISSCSLNKSTLNKSSKSPKYSSDEKFKLTPGRKTPKTPNGDAGDRFIPNRSAMQFELSHYMLNKTEDPKEEETLSPNSRRYREVMSDNLNGDLSNFRIMAYQNKAPNAPAGHANALKVLYSSSKTPGSAKRVTRYIPQAAERILDAPEIIDDYYLNLTDWSANNILAVALSAGLYLWNGSTGDIKHMLEVDEQGEYVSSVCWLPEGGNYLAVGTSVGDVELWDAETQKRIRVMRSHSARVGSLSWNSHILSSGCKSGEIHQHDVRIAEHHASTFSAHTQEVCGLKWAPNGSYLASGGNDNMLNIWQMNAGSTQPLYTFTDHQAAVKAVAWCPWQPSILASGGGTADRHIRFWNCNLGTCLNSLDTKSQVCAILWSNEYKELISGHGFANNELIIWKYPKMSKVTELTGHTNRVLNLCLSPDGEMVMSAGADETLRLWHCFATDPKKKKKAQLSLDEKMSSMMKTIR